MQNLFTKPLNNEARSEERCIEVSSDKAPVTLESPTTRHENGFNSSTDPIHLASGVRGSISTVVPEALGELAIAGFTNNSPDTVRTFSDDLSSSTDPAAADPITIRSHLDQYQPDAAELLGSSKHLPVEDIYKRVLVPTDRYRIRQLVKNAKELTENIFLTHLQEACEKNPVLMVLLGLLFDEGRIVKVPGKFLPFKTHIAGCGIVADENWKKGFSTAVTVHFIPNDKRNSYKTFPVPLQSLLVANLGELAL